MQRIIQHRVQLIALGYISERVGSLVLTPSG
jgi:hypothetical protein